TGRAWRGRGARARADAVVPAARGAVRGRGRRGLDGVGGVLQPHPRGGREAQGAGGDRAVITNVIEYMKAEQELQDLEDRLRRLLSLLLLVAVAALWDWTREHHAVAWRGRGGSFDHLWVFHDGVRLTRVPAGGADEPGGWATGTYLRPSASPAVVWTRFTS